MKQSRVSQIEDPSNEGLTLKTAQRVAKALDVALILRLVPYSKFADFIAGTTSLSMNGWTTPIPAFEEDYPVGESHEDSVRHLIVRGAFGGKVEAYQVAFHLTPDSKVTDLSTLRSGAGPVAQMVG